MTLRWQELDIPIGGGIDTKTNEKLLRPPACADLSDAIFPASGVSGYETRHGYDRIRTSTELSSIDSLATLNSELVVLGGNKAYSVTELPNNTDLKELGDLIACSVDESTLSNRPENQTGGQVIEHNDVRVAVWYDGTSLRYDCTDATTGAVFTSNAAISNGTRAKLCAIGSTIMVVYFNSSTTAIRVLSIPTYAPTTTSNDEIASNAHADGLFDCIEATSAVVFIAYKTDVPACAGVLINESAGTIDTVTYDASHATTCIAVAKGSAELCVAAATSSNVDLFTTPGLNAFGSVTTNGGAKSDAAVNIAYAIDTADQHYLWFEIAGASNQFARVEATSGDGQADVDVDTPTFVKRQCGLASSAFYFDSKPVVHVALETNIQSQYFLLDTSLTAHAKCCVQEGVGIGTGLVTEHLPRVVGNIWAAPFRQNLELDIDPDVTPVPADVYAQSGMKLVRYTTVAPQSEQFGDALYVNAGLLWQYDGVTLSEAGFPVYPEGITSAASNGTGLLDSSTSYSYRVYYEWTNARGERARSATAQIVTQATGASDNTITLTIPTCTHTEREGVSIVVYRTEGNPNIVGGAPFYRVSSPDPSSTGNNAYLENDTSSDAVDFTDGYTDAQLLSKELDYQNTGELDNVTPPASKVMASAKNRIWFAGFEQASRAQYSKLNSRGRDPLENNNTNWIQVPEDGGDITAFAELNFHTVVFKEARAWAISGEGRDNVGQGFFNLPQVASLDVGCVEPRSVVNTPAGVMFKSQKGIWRLGHNLDMQYIGADVEAYNSQNITAATVVPEQNHVIFLTSSGSTLVYNYLIGAWSRFTNHEGTSAVIWNGTYVYARNDGRLYKQNPSSYSDDGVHYSMRFVTAPIYVGGGPQGRQKIRHIRLLGEYYSPHELRVGLRFDHEPGASDSGTWDPSEGVTVSLYGSGAYGAGAYGGSGNPVYQARFNMPRQKCQSVQFIIDTKHTGNAGRAMSIQAMQILVGYEPGLHNVAVESSFTSGE